jgi:glycosyltransferase involved in cell wall biosynthesis
MVAKTDSPGRPHVLMLGLRSVGAGQGGVEAHVDQLVSEMDREGLKVDVVVRSPYSQPGVRNRGSSTRVIPIWSPKGKSTEAFVHSLLAVGYAVWRRPRIVHIHAIGPALVAPLARMMGMHVVMTHHGEDYNREKWGQLARRILRLGERFGATYSNERICVSQSLSENLTKRYDRPFRFIPNGVRQPTPVAANDVLTELGLTAGRYILHVGRIVPEKRQLDLIAAIAGNSMPGIKLVLVGAADHESAYSQEVIDRAAETDNVVIAGFRSGAALAEIFSNAAVFALPSTHEGLPIALLEAMSYGRRVVASDIQANLNVGLPPECYFEAGSVPALQSRLREQFALAVSGEQADWEGLLRQFDWPQIADRTIDVYLNALKLNARSDLIAVA